MRMHLSALVFATASLLATPCVALSRMGEAVVRMDSGKVCFAPAPGELGRPGASDIGAVFVTNVSAQPAKEAWAVQLVYDAGPFRIPRGGCLAYGQQLPALHQVGPAELEPGVIYSAFLKPRLTDRQDSTRGFTAEFCLLRNADQTLRVHQIQWDDKAGRWQREACAAR